MGEDKLGLLQGTLDMLILRSVALKPMHGFGISVRIRQMSQDVLQVEQGSLYPHSTGWNRRGWIAAEWGTSDNNQRTKYYSLTPTGRKQLRVETENWERMSAAINLILGTA